MASIFQSESKMLQSTYSFNLLILIMLLVLTRVNGRAPQKIKGGVDANIDDYPFLVAIKDATGLCGGTLISKKHVLTAAHCVTTYMTDRTVVPQSSLEIILAHHDMFESNQLKFRSADHIDVHETWMEQKIPDCFEADIAILTLNESVPSLEKIPSLTNVSSIPMTEGIILGWGANRLHGWPNPRLQKAETVIIDYNYCELFHDDQLADNTFCTLGDNDDVSFCDGDSGGPFINSNGQIAGIISYTFDCTGSGANMFTDVFPYRAWIQQILKNEKAAETNASNVPKE